MSVGVRLSAMQMTCPLLRTVFIVDEGQQP